jgi:hypothetical protein
MKAIKLLSARIKYLNEKIKTYDNYEPEMLSDYEFAINSVINFKAEILELENAIKILNQNS